jgi:hypothetical protein
MANKVTQCPFGQEILLTFIWNMKGPILVHYKEKGQTVHSATYLAVLKDNLNLAFATREDSVKLL